MGKYFGTMAFAGSECKLTPELAFKLGRYGGYVLLPAEGNAHPHVVVGRDTGTQANY